MSTKRALEPASNSDAKRSRNCDASMLDQIDRKKLDMDREKICSGTSATLNVYCCLTCGKYFQGRNIKSPAFVHSVNEQHQLFLNFKTLKVYVLPDDRILTETDPHSILDSIRYAVMPTYSAKELGLFPKICFDLAGKKYYNGFVGLVSLPHWDYVSTVILCLSHITPIRDYLLMTNPSSSTLESKLNIVIRKLWSPRLFKPYVYMDELLSHLIISDLLKKEDKRDPRNFCLKLLTTLTKPKDVSKMAKVVKDTCQGEITIRTTTIHSKSDSNGDAIDHTVHTSKPTYQKTPFWILTLDLPTTPIFKKGNSANDLPQVGLEQLLSKFEGLQDIHLPRSICTYQAGKLPNYLILHLNRFTSTEPHPVTNRNQTLVEFTDVITFRNARYQLIANIVHDVEHQLRAANMGVDEESRWRVQIYSKKLDKWFEIDRGTVKEKGKELLFLSETYMQIWEKLL